ncbi:MAG: hypothetical protein ACR2IF_09035 [Terriglobales bacterium]
MIQLNHNIAEKPAHNDAGPSSLLQPNGCSQLEDLAKAREEAFTEYLSARHRLSCSGPEAVDHPVAVETFEAARTKLSLTQHNWEEHVAAHHIG